LPPTIFFGDADLKLIFIWGGIFLKNAAAGKKELRPAAVFAKFAGYDSQSIC